MSITALEIAEYRSKHGTESTINLLLLAGPDHFEGDFDECIAYLEAELETEQKGSEEA